jgi:hypothetical protein
MLFLAAAVLAFLAEPANSADFIFYGQNVVATGLAAAQTVEIIRGNVFLLLVFGGAWVGTALGMRDSIAQKSPAACIMLATAVHALFERLKGRTPALARMVARPVWGWWGWLVGRANQALN